MSTPPRDGHTADSVTSAQIAPRPPRPSPQLFPHVLGQREGVSHVLDARRGHVAAPGPLVDGALRHAQHLADVGQGPGTARGEQLNQRDRIRSGEGVGFHVVQISYTTPNRQAPLSTSPSYAPEMPSPSLRTAASQGLARLRASRDLSLAQLADRMGVTKAVVHQLERGHTGETLDRIDSFVAACKGVARLVIYEQQDAERAEVLDLVETLDLGTLHPLLRILRLWGELTPAERDLLALTAEVRTGRAAAPEVGLAALRSSR